jgi:tetratricopeptide (TPR) repeat protein
MEPDNSIAFRRLGWAYYQMQDYDQAKQHWKKMIELAPNDREINVIRKKLTEMEPPAEQMKSSTPAEQPAATEPAATEILQP